MKLGVQVSWIQDIVQKYVTRIKIHTLQVLWIVYMYLKSYWYEIK